jgi:hypothetical protein
MSESLLISSFNYDIALMLGLANRQGILSAIAKSEARSIGSQVSCALFRWILGSFFGGRGK